MAKKTASKTKKAVSKIKTASAKAKKPSASVAAKPVLKKTAVKASGKKAVAKKEAAKKAATVKVAPKKNAAAKKSAAAAKKTFKKSEPAPKATVSVKSNVKKTEKISKTSKPSKEAVKKESKKSAKEAKAEPKIKVSVSKAKKTSATKFEEPKVKAVEADFAAKPKKSKGGHARASESIYFSLEDLDAYINSRDHSATATAEADSASQKAKDASIAPKSQPKVEAKAKGNSSVGVASIFDILGFDPGIAPTREKIEEKDIPRKWKKYYGLLIDLRKRYSQGIEGRAEEVLKRSAKEDSGDLSSYGQHLADAGSESFDRDMAFNILSGEKEILAEIDEAIKRIKNGTYGVCEYTGNPIPDERLTAVPYTRFSKEGREQKEAELNRAKSSQRSLYDIPETPTPGGDDDAS